MSSQSEGTAAAPVLYYCATGSGLSRSRIHLTKFHQSLCSFNCIGSLSLHSFQEQREPRPKISRLSRCLQRFVVAGTIALKIRTDIEHRRVQPSSRDEEQHDQQSTQPPVAIKEWMQRFELIMQQSVLHQNRQDWLFVGELFPISQQTNKFARRWRDKYRRRDVRTRARGSSFGKSATLLDGDRGRELRRVAVRGFLEAVAC